MAPLLEALVNRVQKIVETVLLHALEPGLRGREITDFGVVEPAVVVVERYAPRFASAIAGIVIDIVGAGAGGSGGY